MARTETTVEVVRRTQVRYVWPDVAINIWVIVMLAAGGLFIGVFASFVNIQGDLHLPNPWLFTFGIVTGCLTIIFIIIFLVLISQRRLLPFTVIVLSVVLFALYMTGLIETAIQLFGSGSTNVNKACNQLHNYGSVLDTLAYLEQEYICNCWYAVFSFWIIGCVFLIWVIIIAATIANNQGT